MAKLASVLLIAPPGRLRDGLCVLLRASAEIERIQLDDGAAAGLVAQPCGGLEPPQGLAASPDLIVLDAEVLDGRAWPAALLRLQRRWPECACIVAPRTASQERRARQAGARHVLPAGFSAQALRQMIETLGTRPGADPAAAQPA